jgi:hypothetical protein
MKNSFLIFILFSIPSFAQKPSDSLISGFYNITLKSIFPNTLNNNSSLVNNKVIFLKTESDTTKLIKSFGEYKIKFFTKDDDLYKLLKKPYKKSNGLYVYDISYKITGKDSVDVIINGRTLTLLNRRSFYLSLWCRGGFGYVPEGRFVYSNQDKNWNFFSREFILAEKEKIREIKRKKSNSP